MVGNTCTDKDTGGLGTLALTLRQCKGWEPSCLTDKETGGLGTLALFRETGGLGITVSLTKRQEGWEHLH